MPEILIQKPIDAAAVQRTSRLARAVTRRLMDRTGASRAEIAAIYRRIIGGDPRKEGDRLTA